MWAKIILAGYSFISLSCYTFPNNAIGENRGAESISSVNTIDGQTLVRLLDESGSNTKLHLFDKNKWLVLEKGVVWKTMDSGQNWREVTYRDKRRIKAEINTISFYNENSGYALSIKTQEIWHTDDQGENWINKGKFAVEEKADPLFPFTNMVETIHFFDDKRGVAGGGPYVNLGLKTVRMWITDDAGHTWQEKYNPISEYERGTIYDFFFIDSQIGWAAGVNCLLKTNDSGNTWQQVNQESYYLNKTQWLNEKVGWANKQPIGYMVTTDSGKTWKSCQACDSIYLIEANKGLCLSESGKISYIVEGQHEWLVEGALFIDNKDYQKIVEKDNYCYKGKTYLGKLENGNLISIWYGVNICQNKRPAVGFKSLTSTDGGVTWR